MNTYIDIVGACNLSCPSCPMGNSENVNFIDFSTGAFTSGYQHYVLFGRLEGRLGAGYLTVV